MVTKTFKRYEIKYFVTPEQRAALQPALDSRMRPDAYCINGGSYTIYNVYYDTDGDDIIRRSVEKPYFKEKLRMRSYTMPACGGDDVFLELKKKIGGIVAKRRAVMTCAEAADFMETGAVPALEAYEDRQVLSEISGFLSRFSVRPRVFISYERVAYFDRDDPALRVSFDANILTRRTEVNLTAGDYGTELLDTDGILMEIKCGGAIPLWLCRLLSELGIRRTNFSKYGTEYKNYCALRRGHAGAPAAGLFLRDMEMKRHA